MVTRNKRLMLRAAEVLVRGHGVGVIAEKFGRHPTAVSHWLKHGVPLRHVEKLSKTLHVPAASIRPDAFGKRGFMEGIEARAEDREPVREPMPEPLMRYNPRTGRMERIRQM